MTTGQSAATRVFPAWVRELGVDDVRLVGCDLPIHAPRERYREVVERIKRDDDELGGLVTTHKIDIFNACRDMFDGIDDYAELCGEASCLAKREGRLWAHATDPISSARALAEFYPASAVGDVLCLGAGGSAMAITVHLMQARRGLHITIVNRSPARLEAMRTTHARLGSDAQVRYIENSDPEVNDRLMAELHPGALVINATGMGKDTPGSPITDAAAFPTESYVWELNYRGELEFLHQARRQADARRLRVEDGWRYFIHGWAAVMEKAFHVQIGGDQIARLAAVSEAERPAPN